MSIDSAINYILFTNPVSSATSSIILKTSQAVISSVQSVMPKPQTQVIVMESEPLWKLTRNGGWFVRIAGLSGAMAVSLGAYGAHKLIPCKEIEETRKQVFETANRYHFFHTLALLGVPFCRYPAVTGSLMFVGMAMFTGSSYYFALTGDNRLRRITPVGGSCLILGWITMML